MSRFRFIDKAELYFRARYGNRQAAAAAPTRRIVRIVKTRRLEAVS